MWVGGRGLLAFLYCVLCARPGLGWVPYPVFTLSHFSDPPTPHTLFPSSPLNTPTLANPFVAAQPLPAPSLCSSQDPTPSSSTVPYIRSGRSGPCDADAPSSSGHLIPETNWWRHEGVWYGRHDEFESHSITNMKAFFNWPDNILWSFLMMIKE